MVGTTFGHLEKDQQQEAGITEGTWPNCQTSNSRACHSRYSYGSAQLMMMLN